MGGHVVVVGFLFLILSQANGLFLMIVTGKGVGRMNGRTSYCCFLISSQANGLVLVIVTRLEVGRMKGRTSCCWFLILSQAKVVFDDRQNSSNW